MKGYKAFTDYNSSFCPKLPQWIAVPSTDSKMTKDQLVQGVKKYSKSKGSGVICENPVLKRSYVFTRTHTGRDFLHILVNIVNSSEFKVGNYFYFKMDTTSNTPDVVLLANPTKRQPGNGVIVSSADNCQPKSWDKLMAMLLDNSIQEFSRYFKEFMMKSVDAQVPPHFVEIAALLIFEIGRRRVAINKTKNNSHKRRLDAIPVASCIAICLNDQEKGIRACRDVFGHRCDRNYPKKIRKREEAARKILGRNKGIEYRELMAKLFSLPLPAA